MAVKVVNMIPNSMSNESTRDSEPNITASFLDPLQIAASAFTPDPGLSGSAPIYISTDGGDTWVLNVVLPGGNKTNDTTLRFVGPSNVLYAGILTIQAGAPLNILRKATFTAPGLMDVLFTGTNFDQPYVEGATVMGGAGTGADRVYVGVNDFNKAPKSASIDFSLDAAATPVPGGFVAANFVSIESRATSGQDGPPVRPAVHLDGTVYGVYQGWRSGTTMDIVVVRDNSWASGATPFTDLVDSGSAGMRVVTGVNRCPFASLLGTQRVGASGAIAVDPRDSTTVYIAWADGTTGANQTIHVRSSNTSGVTWSSADVRTIAAATNPALAINSHGEVGFLYQKLHNPGSGNRWETHFETLVSASDTILADVPDSNGTYTGPNPIGDYAGLIAVGKNFYGIFCGNNTPDNANFPQGVTYQRNADFVTHTLKDLASTPVAASIDPFFFKVTTVAPSDDFYVRDWTDTTTSGDNGAEPSTHSVFYHTSDVWNRRGTLSGWPFTANDQPDNEDAGNGAGNIGDNWAFARIRRNAPAASGSQTVTAHFLVSEFGTGSNFVDSTSDIITNPNVVFVDPDPTVTFNASDVAPVITAGCHWQLAAVASTHLCLAVEITGPNDPYVLPSLLGNTPGWPMTDLRIINDNNKAQRNMGLSTTPARGVGGSDCYCAIVHNAATFTRDFELRYEATPEVARAFKDAVIEVIGGKEQPFKAKGSLKLAAMQPGENRWVALRFPAVAGKQGQVLAVNFFEVAHGIVVNGFAMGARLGTQDQVFREKLERHRSVFARMAAGFDVAEAKASAETAGKLASKDKQDARGYLQFMQGQLPVIERALKPLVPSRQDPFRILPALQQLGRLVAAGQADAIALGHSCMLNRIDSFLTMRRLENGNVADILQNVRWQKDLYRLDARLAKLKCAAGIRQISEQFILAYGARKISNKDYPALLRSSFQCFVETARALKQPALQNHIDEMKKYLDDLGRLQKAHREFLLELQSNR
jgi:hypothetical protein